MQIGKAKDIMTIAELEQMIDCYGKSVYSFCLHITGNRQEAEELYQDTFLKATELIHKIKRDGNPKSYFCSIAIFLWRNRKRKYAWRQRIMAVESTDVNDIREEIESLQEQNTPERQLIKQEQIEYVQRCIRELDEKYKIPLCLYYSADFTVNEIAECLKLPQGTIKSRLYKARMLIKERMEVAGYDQ